MDELARSADDLALVLDADIEAQSRTAGPDQVLRVVARRLAELCHAPDGGHLTRWRARTCGTLVSWELRPVRPTRTSSDGRPRWPTGRSSKPSIATGRAERSSRPSMTRDSPETERDGLQRRNAQSSLSIPLLSNGRVIGVAEVLDNRPRDFVEVAAAGAGAGRDRRASARQGAAARDPGAAQHVSPGDRQARSAHQRREPSRGDGRLRRPAPARRPGRRLLRGPPHRARPACASSPASTAEAVPRGTTAPTHRRPRAGCESRCRSSATTRSSCSRGPDDPRLTPDEREVWARAGFASQLSLPLVIDSRLVGLIDVFDVRASAGSPTTSTSRAASASSWPAPSTTCCCWSGSPSPTASSACSPSRASSSAPPSTSPRCSTPSPRGCASRRRRPAATSTRSRASSLRGLVSTDGSAIDDAFPGTTYDLGDFAIARRAIELGRPVVVADIPGDPRLTAAERAEDMRWGYTSAVELPAHRPRRGDRRGHPLRPRARRRRHDRPPPRSRAARRAGDRQRPRPRGPGRRRGPAAPDQRRRHRARRQPRSRARARDRRAPAVRRRRRRLL